MATLENIHTMKPRVCHHQLWKNIHLDGKVRHVKEMRKIKIVNLLECEKYGCNYLFNFFNVISSSVIKMWRKRGGTEARSGRRSSGS